jgi:hypothetical protein
LPKKNRPINIYISLNGELADNFESQKQRWEKKLDGDIVLSKKGALEKILKEYFRMEEEEIDL